MNKVLKRNIKKHLKALPTAKKIAADAVKGIAKRGWYTRANKTLSYLFPHKTSTFIAILAATSPRQTVAKNLDMTIAIFDKWKESGYKTDDDTLETLALMSDLPARQGNVKRAILGRPLSGNKVKSFNDNLNGNMESVTIDTWMLTYAGLYNSGLASSKGGYIAYSHRLKRAARLLGWKPAEIQECIWSYAYSQVNKVSIEEVPEFNIEGVIA